MSEVYHKCVACDHFVEDNADKGAGVAEYTHLDDHDIEYDHEPIPETQGHPLSDWKAARPDLFEMHGDGHIGPNSPEHLGHGTRTKPMGVSAVEAFGLRPDGSYPEPGYIANPNPGDWPTGEVYVVNLTESEDGLYVFARREDAEAFKALSGDDATLTTEPILDAEFVDMERDSRGEDDE